MRWRLRDILWPLLLMAVLAYFADLAWQGRTGLAEERALAAKEAALAAELALLKQQRARLAARVRAMRSTPRDHDLLDEVARTNGYSLCRPPEPAAGCPDRFPACKPCGSCRAGLRQTSGLVPPNPLKFVP